MRSAFRFRVTEVRIRIHKALADAGVASRRSAELLVAAGRVRVNGEPAQIGQRVDPQRDAIVVDGQPLAAAAAHVYIALNKPPGVTSTVDDRHAERTVLDLLPPDLRRGKERLYPVGRLDRESEGLILLTNDGAWAQRLLHPRYEVEREYAVGLARPLTREQAARLGEGIQLEEGLARLHHLREATTTEIDKLRAATEGNERRLIWYRTVLRQGWRRQLRRMFAEVGNPVTRLVRVRIGTLRIDGLRPGQARRMSGRDAARVAPPVARDHEPETARPAGPGISPTLVVSLDGPGSSGKSSVGAGAAARLGFRFCDTGLLYRALTWLAMERRLDLDDSDALVALVPEIELTEDEGGRLTRVRTSQRDVTELVREPRVDRQVSRVALQSVVREALLPVQRALAAGGRIIMAGRDIGSVVLPDADVKLFLDVSLPERARRRAEERGLEVEPDAVAVIEADLQRRDQIDTTREVAPLRVPTDAIVITTDGNTLEQTIEAVVAAVQAAAARPR